MLYNNCISSHTDKKHQITYLSRYDSTCLENNQYFSHYCKNCNKIFVYYIILLSQIFINEYNLQKKKNIENNIFKIENI